MAKIDRLGWAAGIAISTYGVRVGIRVTDSTALESIVEGLPPQCKILKSPTVDVLYSMIVGGNSNQRNIKRFSLLYKGAMRIVKSLEPSLLFDRLESDLRLTVAEITKQYLFVHSGVVGWEGKAILIPGRSLSGKSTLTHELVKAGAQFYSDEYALIDKQGLIHPYTKFIYLRDDTYKQTKYSIEELGGKIGKKPLPIGLVLVGKYKSNSRWNPHPLSNGQGILALLDNTIPARTQSEIALTRLGKATKNVLMLKGFRGEANQVAPRILEMLSSNSKEIYNNVQS